MIVLVLMSLAVGLKTSKLLPVLVVGHA